MGLEVLGRLRGRGPRDVFGAIGASQNDHLEVVRALLAAKADVHHSTDWFRDSTSTAPPWPMPPSRGWREGGLCGLQDRSRIGSAKHQQCSALFVGLRTDLTDSRRIRVRTANGRRFDRENHESSFSGGMTTLSGAELKEIGIDVDRTRTQPKGTSPLDRAALGPTRGAPTPRSKLLRQSGPT